MSSYALTRPAPRWTSRLRTVLNGFLTVRKTPALPVEQLQPLSDRLLDDIGVDPRCIPRPAQEAAVRLGLLDAGWQPPRRLNRR